METYFYYRPFRKISEESIILRKEKSYNKLEASLLTRSGSLKWRMNGSLRMLFVTFIVLVLGASTLMLGMLFDARLHPAKLVKGLPYAAAAHLFPIARRIVEDNVHVVPHSTGLVSVHDIVAFPDEVMLVVGVVVRSDRVLPRKEDILCLFGQTQTTRILSIEWTDDRRSDVAVRCEHPRQALQKSKEATIVFRETNFVLPSTALYVTNSSWNPLVYETLTLPDSVLLFAKGLVDSRGKPFNYSKSLHNLNCRFGSEVQTRVKVIAQEVVRCELPPVNVIQKVRGTKVSLFVPKMGVLPSVAYFDIPDEITRPTKRPFHICSCTMLWNQAQFLREWITYHGFLGIERWYLYDNNSDDEIGEVLASLPGYNVSRHAWPWIKTQEAGFSHCLLRARADCEWVMFVDVDEFIYPKKEFQQLSSRLAPSSSSLTVMVTPEAGAQISGIKLKQSRQQLENSWNRSHTSILRRLIERTVKKGLEMGKIVGEVRFMCHNFGPSGLARAPKDGVLSGYTCRMKWPKRHKSIIRVDAVSDSLLNKVHHFELREGFKEMAVPVREAVINHYKFQAWEVFKAKFVRRVATYVVDWREQTSNSNDRAPSLGLEAVEPRDWPSRYCEEVDWGLKNYTKALFSHPETDLLPWEKE